MAFGLSFGSRRQRTNQDTTFNRNENTTQAQSGTTNTSGVTTQNTNTSNSGSTNSQQNTSQNGTTNSQGSQTGSTAQRTQSFSDSTLGSIESAVNDLFGTVGTRAPISAFDKEAYVRDTLGAASADINSGLESNVNQLVTNLGGTASTNSMGALLTNRLRNDAAAELAGVRTQATSQAEEISRNNALADSQMQGQDQNYLTQLLSALRGGVTTTTGTESTQNTQSQQTAQSGTANTAEQSASQQSQQSTQTQQLIEMMSQLLNGSTNSSGTENVRSTTRSSGGGFSLGL